MNLRYNTLVKWVEQGEKPSRYFLALENRNFTSKIIPKLIKSDGTVTTDQQEIISETETFYKDLYTEDSNIENVDLNILFKDVNVPKLSNEESSELDGPITFTECSETLKGMKNNKSPGTVGFTAEFC